MYIYAINFYTLSISTQSFTTKQAQHTHICTLPFHDSCNKTQETQVLLCLMILCCLSFSANLLHCAWASSPFFSSSRLKEYWDYFSGPATAVRRYGDLRNIHFVTITHFSDNAKSCIFLPLCFLVHYYSVHYSVVWKQGRSEKRTDLMSKNMLSINIRIWNQYFFNNNFFFSFLYLKCYHLELHRKPHEKCHGWQRRIEH